MKSDLQKIPIVPYIRESDYASRAAYDFPFRRLLDYLLIYIRKGTLQIQADGEKYLLTEGEFAFLQPGTVHNLKTFTDNETPFAHLDLFYDETRESRFPTRPGQVDLAAYQHLMQPRLSEVLSMDIPVVLRPAHPSQYRRLMLQMIESWLSPDPLRKLQAQALGTQLVYEIIRDHVADSAAPAHLRSQLDWIPSYLSFHIAEPIKVEDMARRAHLSPSRFREVFRERFGMPPHQYLILLRLDYARELLGNTSYTLSEIAEYCGFTDVSHLSKTCKERTGMTPGEYRLARQMNEA